MKLSRTAILQGVSLFLLLTIGSASFTFRGAFKRFDGKERMRYHFVPATPRALDSTIPSLEARCKVPHPSALDLSELASAYFQQGHLSGDPTWYDKAEEAAKHSLKLLPSPNFSGLTLAKIADAKHDFPGAIRLAEEIMKTQPTQGALGVLVSSHLALGDLTEAARYADQGVDFKPETSAYLMRALVLAAQGREEEAEFDFQRAAAVEDIGNYYESARLRALWGRFLARHGQYEDADFLFGESLSILPGNHLALALRGEMEMQRGNYPLAQKYLMDGFTASKQLRYLIHYARAKALGGDAKAAAEVRTMAEKLVRDELKSGRFGHRLELVELLLDKGQSKDVREAAATAKEEIKVRRSAEAYYFLARSLFAAGETESAIEPIRAALRTGVKDPEYFGLAASIEKVRGNLAHSGFYKKFATRLDPSRG
jgi:tetratricopeptide (TPR) repeat protein